MSGSKFTPEVRGALIERFAAGVSTEDAARALGPAQDGQGLAHPWSAEGEGEYADFAEAVERAREAARERPGPMNEDELARVVSRDVGKGSVQYGSCTGRFCAPSATANPWTPLAEFWTNWRRDVPAELDAFKRFCREELTTDLGEPLIVEPFQRRSSDRSWRAAGPTSPSSARRTASRACAAPSACSCLLAAGLLDCVVSSSARDQAQYVLDQCAPAATSAATRACGAAEDR